MVKEKVILFGASKYGECALEILKKKYKVIYFCDNDLNKVGKYLNGIKVISTKKLLEINYDYIIITSTYVCEILGQLDELKIRKNKIKIYDLIDKNVLDILSITDQKIKKYFDSKDIIHNLFIYGELFTTKNRNELLIEFMNKKRVVHVGCVDHLNLIDFKMNNNMYLHKLVTDSAEVCIGIDINKKGINFMKPYFDNIHYVNILNDNNILKNQYDILLIPDVLEHLLNPFEFLSTINKKYDNFKELIISVPNAFSQRNDEFSKLNMEIINSDHKFLFSPYTICNLVHNAGFKINELILCDDKNEVSSFKSENLIIKASW